MKRLTLFLALFLLASCGWLEPSAPVVAGPAEVLKGWKLMDVPLAQTDLDSGGVADISTAGPWILVRTNTDKAFLHREGDTSWRELKLPSGDKIKSISGWRDSLFLLGGLTKGEIWQYSPQTGTYLDLQTGLTRRGEVRVWDIADFGASYSAFFSVYSDTSKICLIGNGIAGDWQQRKGGIPWIDVGHVQVRMDTTQVIGTFESGLFRWNDHDTVWRKIPSPWVRGAEDRFSRGLAWMGNVLWVGYWADGLYKYTSLDTAGTIVPNPTPEGLAHPRSLWVGVFS